MSTRLAKKKSRKNRKKSKNDSVFDVDSEYDEDFELDILPEIIPLSVQIASEPDLGKTHFARTWPNPFFLDTEAKAGVVLQKFEPVPWKRVEKFNDIRQGILWAIDNDDVDTIVIDSSSDIRDMSEQEWCREEGAERVWPKVLWAQVYEKIDWIVPALEKAGKNLVVTARMKDEYIADSSTGRRIVDSYKKYPFALQIAIKIRHGIPDGKGNIEFEDKKFGEVQKNNFHGVDPITMKTKLKPYIFDISYEGVQKEMLEPWHPETDGVKLSRSKEQIIEDAREWILEHG